MLCRIVAPLLEQSGGKPSAAALTKHLLNTLSEESNPITHSDIYERSGGLFFRERRTLLTLHQIIYRQPRLAISVAKGDTVA